LKIGLNGTCFNDRPSGAKQRFIGIYGELVKRLPEAEIVVYEPIDCRVGAWFDDAPNVTVRRTPVPSQGCAQKLLRGLFYWPTAISREGFDIFEAFNIPNVKAPTGKTLLTIHDIRGMRSESGVLKRAAFKVFLERTLRAADHVITVSEAMKVEILGFFPWVPISVIYNGLDLDAFDTVKESNLETVRIKYSLPESFLLAVGHLEPRKNYLKLIDAMVQLRDRGQPCNLIIIGNDSGQRQMIESKTQAVGLR